MLLRASCCVMVLPPCRASAAMDEIRDGRARNAERINAAMLVKPAVLRRHHRFAEEFRHRLVGGQRDAVFIKETAEGMALVIVKDRGLRHLAGRHRY